jgi:hypothetical protein
MLKYIFLFEIKTFPIIDFNKRNIDILKKSLTKEILSSLKKGIKYKFAISYALIFILEERILREYPKYLYGLFNGIYPPSQPPILDEHGKEEKYYNEINTLETFKKDFLINQSLLDLQFILKIIKQTNEKHLN